MAEANTAEKEAKADAAFGAAFGAHSDDTPPAPAEKVVEVVPKVEPIVAPAPVVVPEKPQYVRVTKQEWDNTKAATGKVKTLESQIAKLTSNAPNADKIAQQVLENLRSQTPAGLNVEISDEDFAELAADFPELAKHTRAAVEKIFKKANVKGKGPAPTPATPPAAPVDVNAEVEKVLLRREHEALAKTFPDWSDIVGRPLIDGDPPPEGNSFRAWLGTQSAEYQKAVNETNSPADVRDAIASFKASQITSASPSPRSDRAAARRAVIEDAVTPRADGNPPPLNRPQTAEEAFGNAFKRAKSH